MGVQGFLRWRVDADLIAERRATVTPPGTASSWTTF
jgi:hypothetical protein